MISVTIKHGLESIQKQFTEPTYVRDILGNSSILSAIEASESSTALVGGSNVDGSYQLQNGDVLVLERQAASKA
jgi:hypothetical protein